MIVPKDRKGNLRNWSNLRFRLQCGQSTMEYVVVCAALTISLGIGLLDDTSVLWVLINAFKTAYKNFSYALSLPT